MSNGKFALSLIATFLMVGGAFAQSGGHAVQRDINQQNRIEQGLQSGSLSTREASRLEREESRVERMQAHAAKDGNVSAAERVRIDAAQNKVSQDIYREKHDAQVGNPNAASSQRMQQNVQHNINQQERIKEGMKSGELTNREVGRLERGEAHVNRMQADAGANGHVNAQEQRMVQRAERPNLQAEAR